VAGHGQGDGPDSAQVEDVGVVQLVIDFDRYRVVLG
jgi:hypothetical protein